jgi:hypothetical protein
MISLGASGFLYFAISVIQINSSEPCLFTVIGIPFKINYRIHTDAIKQNLVPKALSKQQTTFIYATEADVLNMALFGKTAKQLLNQLKNSL